MDFTYKSYSRMIDLLRNNGYAISDYRDGNSEQKCAILRHDVDYSVDKALQFAKLEYKLGVRSNYFILLTSPFYNIASKDILVKIKEIINLGHNVGLHFDEMNYEHDFYEKKGGINKAVLEEIRIMESILNIKISLVSMHRPSMTTLEADYDFGEIINSYSREFFGQYKYVSDSRMRWRENVYDIITSGKFKKLHILTHAFWYNDENVSIENALKKFILEAGCKRYDALSENISNIENLIKREDFVCKSFEEWSDTNE